jgi:hypothetical protein
MWVDAHQVADALDFGRFNEDAALASRATLEIVDRYGPTTDYEQTPIRSSQPIVKRGSRDAQLACGLCGGKHLVAHLARRTEG